MSLILKAAAFARSAHSGVTRKYNSDPYVFHVMRVAGLVTMHTQATEAMVAAAWLHDTVEDCTSVTFPVIQREFGPEVTDWVADVTNPSAFAPLSQESRSIRKQADLEHLRQARWEGKLIKLCDILDNARDFDPSQAGSFTRKWIAEKRAQLEVLGEADLQLQELALQEFDRLENGRRPRRY